MIRPIASHALQEHTQRSLILVLGAAMLAIQAIAFFNIPWKTSPRKPANGPPVDWKTTL